MTKPIDRSFRARWQIALLTSRQQGRDLAEYLNQVGMLLTNHRRKELLARELRRAAAELENISPIQICQDDGRTGLTALDMQRGTVAWLRHRASLIEKGE